MIMMRCGRRSLLPQLGSLPGLTSCWGVRPGSDGLAVEVYVVEVEVEVSDDDLFHVGEGVAEHVDQHP